ncbi:MAG: hypothetical protein ACI8Z7_000671 [Candidatus Nanohaloarchaea archaeon]|jgi:hypothetical protein
MAIEWTNKEDWDQEQDNTGVIHDETLQQGYKSGSLKEGLVAYYPMENSGSEILRDGARKNTGQINGATWNGSGKVGNDSLSFDGSNSETVDASAFGVISISKEFSVSLFVNCPSGNDGDLITNIHSASDRLALEISSSEVRVGVYNGSNYTGESSGSIQKDQWVHIHYNHYSDNSGQLFIDGVEQTGTNTPTTGATQGFRLGARTDDQDFYTGEMDDVRVYDRTLSYQEIQALSNLTFSNGKEITEDQVPNQNNGGISRYKFNGDVTDSWGSNNGTDNTSAGYVNGVYGQAKDFDGSDDHISLSPKDFSSTYTFSAWINLNGTSGNVFLHALDSDNTTSNPLIQYDGVDLQLYDERNGYDAQYTYTPSTGVWYHLVAVGTGSEGRIYLNGELKSTGTMTSNSFNGNDVMEVGVTAYVDKTDYLNGQIDDVRLYDRALSPVEIEKLFHLGARRINRKEVLH